MPVRESGQGGGRRRRREPGERTHGAVAQEVAERQDAAPAPVPSTVQAVARIERESKQTLPTSLVLSLAGLGLDERDEVRAARVLARRFEIAPAYVFGTTDPSKYKHPVTGEPLTMKEAIRFTARFSPVAVAAMLEEQTAATSEGARLMMSRKGGRLTADAGEVVDEVDADKVAAFARVVSRTSPGLEIAEGMGVSVWLARNAGVPAGRFEKNLAAVRDWAETSGQPLDGRSLIETTVSLTRKRRSLDNAQAVFEVIAGGKEQAEELARVTADTEKAVRIRDAIVNEQPVSEEDRQWFMENGGALNVQDTTREALQYDLLAFTAPDLWQDVKRIESSVQLRQNAFQRSLVGKAIDPVVRAFDQTWEWTQQGLIQVGTVIEGSVIAAGAAAGLDPQGEGVRDNLEALGRANNYAFQRIKRGDTIGDLVVEGHGLPSWVSPAFDFFVGWYVDPFVVGGKVAGFRRAARVVPGLRKANLLGTPFLDVPVLGSVIKARRADVLAQDQARFIKYITKTLPESRLTTKLFKALPSNTKFFRELDSLYGVYKSRGVFDYEYMKLLRDRVLLRYGKNGVIPAEATDEAMRAFREGITAHYTGWAPEGTVAEEVVNARRTRMIDASRELEVPQTGVQLSLYDELYPPNEIVHSTVQEYLRGTGKLIPFSPEAPSSGFFADVGPRRLGRRILTSDVATSVGPGRRGSRLISLNPGRMANIEDAIDEYAILHARRFAQFTETEVRTFQSRMLEILNSGVGRENRAQALIEEITTEGIRRRMSTWGVSDEVIDEFIEAKLEAFRTANNKAQAFGAVDGKAVTRPIFESQLRNTFLVPDPVELLRDARQWVGVRRAFRAEALSAIGKLPPELAAPINDILARSSIKTWEGILKGARGYQKIWKALTVARPGYIPRVILGDENARFFATTQSLSERLLAQDFGRILGRRGKGVLDDLFAEKVQLGPGPDDFVILKRPGALDYEPLAASKTRETELLADALRRAGETERAMENGHVSWNVLEASKDAKAHLAAWHWALTKQLRNSTPGRIALESVAQGRSIEETRAALMAWAQEDKFVTLISRIGRPIDEADDWALATAKLAHGYTMGNARLADLALAGDDEALRIALDGIKKAERPPVHGPTVVAHTTTADGDAITDATNWLYKRFVRQPEDVLNRQPYYKTWKRRAERGYYELLRDAGAGKLPSPNIVIPPGKVPSVDDIARADKPIQLRVYHGNPEGVVKPTVEGGGGMVSFALDPEYARTFASGSEIFEGDIILRKLWDERAHLTPELRGQVEAALEARGLDLDAPQFRMGAPRVADDVKVVPNPDGTVTITGWHGTPTGQLPGPDVELGFGGFHFGSKDAADTRLYQTAADQLDGAGAGAANVLPVEVRGRFFGLEDGLTEIDNTVLEAGGLQEALGVDLIRPDQVDELSPAVRQIAEEADARGVSIRSLLEEKGYSGWAYVNDVEDSGTKSFAVFSMENVRRAPTGPTRRQILAEAETLEDVKNIAPYLEGDVTSVADLTQRIRVVDGNLTAEDLEWRNLLDELGYDGVLMRDRSAATTTGWEIRALQDRYVPAVPEAADMLPEIRQAVDVASREFALGQVRRIMFDFTRQSRFTELLQMVFPFPQPFFEGFQAWTHIAWRHPEAIGRAQALYRAGRESGFVREDPVSGELVVGMGAYAHAARLAAMLPGIDKKSLDSLGLSFVAPLASFNMLAASTLKIPSDGLLGRIAGGMPVPVPGMNVPLQILAQELFSDTTNEALTSWLFQYGPNTSPLPSTVKRVVNFVAPGLVKDGREDSYALAIMERWQQLGLDRDEDGNLIPPEKLSIMAQEAATDLAAVQGFVSLVSPAALRAQFGTEDLKAEWAALLQKHEYTAAREIWDERYPDLPLIPIANTFFTDPEATAAYGQPTQAGYGDKNAPRIPASPFTQRMLNEPTIGDFMRNNPEWAALVLVGVDPASLESQDFSAFAGQLADHLVAYKDGVRFAREGQDALAWREIDKFYRQVWTPGMDRLDREGLDTQDDFYQGMIQARQEAFLSIALEFPDFADRYFDPRYDAQGEVVGYDWLSGAEGKHMRQILEDARQIASTPGFENAPGFRALNRYLDLRDEIHEQMTDKGIHYLDQTNARSLWKKYEAGVNEIVDAVPGIEPFLSSYFGIQFSTEGTGLREELEPTGKRILVATDDLMGLAASERILARRELAAETLTEIDAFDTKLEKLRDRAYRSQGAELSWERSNNYLEAQRFMDTQDPELVKQWWKVQDKDYKRDYIVNLATKPPEFYSRHDWSLVGIELDDTASDHFLAIADARVRIAQNEQDAAGSYSESEGYAAINKWVRERLSKKHPEYSKSFAQAVKKLNEWSFPLEAAGYVRRKGGKLVAARPGKEGRAWLDFAETLNETQAYVESREMLGINYPSFPSDEAILEKNQYSQGQKAMEAWIEEQKRNVPGFKRSWNAMKESYGDILIGNVFMPDNYFGKLGSIDYGDD